MKGTLHWVSAEKNVEATVDLYDNLFTIENPSDVPEGKEFTDFLNPESKIVLEDVKLEAALAQAQPGQRFQFMRQGFFYIDPELTTDERLVFNEIVPLRDSWAKISQK